MQENLKNIEIQNGYQSQVDIDEILQKRRIQLSLKRYFDFLLSLSGLILLMPLFIIISIVIKVDSRGPIFFKQERVGMDEKLFGIFKFRTMVVNAEKKGLQITVGNDTRITDFGRILRKSKMDELPQLINVLLGDMSFVGPRPEVPKYVALYNGQQRKILRIRPGITDLASIEFRNENSILSKSCDPEIDYIEKIMPEKIILNIIYIKNISLIYDIGLILKTLYLVFRRK